MKRDLKECIIEMELTGCAQIELKVLKQKYRELAKKYHPDIAEERYRDGQKMKKINEAYDILMEEISTAEIKNPLYRERSNSTRGCNTAQKKREKARTYSRERTDKRDYSFLDHYKELKWIYVKSSNLRKVAYDDIHSCLFVEFKSSGTVYYYLDVPRMVYERLLSAPSKGKFFCANIMNHYAYGNL